MLRASMLLFLPLALAWVVIISADKKKALKNAALAIVGVLLVMTPLLVRNYIVSRDIVFLDISRRNESLYRKQ